MKHHFSRASTAKEDLPPPVEEVVEEHDTEIEAITASFLGIQLPSIFPKRNGKYQTNLPFKDLVKLYEDLLKASKKLDKVYRTFQKSKKEEEVQDPESEGTKTTGNYIWSMSELAKLVEAMENVQGLAAYRVSPESGLLTICTGSPDNPVCWNTQGNITKVLNGLKKRMSKINNEISDFFLSNGDFREELLYLEEGWDRASLDSGSDYIYNKVDTAERYWLGREVQDIKAPSSGLDPEDVNYKV